MISKKEEVSSEEDQRLFKIFQDKSSISELIDDPRYKFFLRLGWSLDYNDRVEACIEFLEEYSDAKNDYWLSICHKHLSKQEKSKLLLTRDEVRRAECFIKHRFVEKKKYEKALVDAERELLSKKKRGASVKAIVQAYQKYTNYFSELIKHVSAFSLGKN